MRGTFIRKTIRRLEKRFGTTVVLKNETGRTTNLATGALSRTFESLVLGDCMVRPVTLQRDFAYGLSFLAANKNFTYGGKFDKGIRQVSILRDRLPSGFVIDLRTLILVNNQPCVIKLVEQDQTEGLWYYRLIVVETESADLGEISVQGLQADIGLTVSGPVVVIG